MVSVDSLIDSRIKVFSDSLRDGAVDAAARIDSIRSAIPGQCDTDTSDEVKNLSLPVHVVDMLDSLRRTRPTVFQALVAGAIEFSAGDPKNRGINSAAIADRILAVR
jgi:hypothetical protein